MMGFLLFSLCAMLLGFLLDFLFGDPHWLPHPVRLIGWLISFFERLLRKVFSNTPKGERIAGAFLVILICILSTGLPLLLLWGAWQLSVWLYLIVETLMCYQLLAARALQKESMLVYQALKEKDLPKARKAVSMIVGRDTQNLTDIEVAKAAIETVAENTSDGVAAPLCYLALGGAPLGFFYKAVNTMDSMVGYQNEQYLYFGRAAAKFDDLCNYLPARLSGWLMVIASYLCGFDYRGAKRIYLRDKMNHKSPNSAHTEAACAGALGICLAGDAYYFGHLVHKPNIGDKTKEVEYEDIKRANQLMYMTSLLTLFLLAVVKWLLLFLLSL